MVKDTSRLNHLVVSIQNLAFMPANTQTASTALGSEPSRSCVFLFCELCESLALLSPTSFYTPPHLFDGPGEALGVPQFSGFGGPYMKQMTGNRNFWIGIRAPVKVSALRPSRNLGILTLWDSPDKLRANKPFSSRLRDTFEQIMTCGTFGAPHVDQNASAEAEGTLPQGAAIT